MERKEHGRRTIWLVGSVVLLVGGGVIANTLWLEAKAWLAQELIEQAWTRTLAGEEAVRPWPWAETWPIARLTMPSGQALYILNGFTREALAFGPGHLSASSMPGRVGAMVLAGHQDSHFRFLQSIAAGDEITIQTADGHVYRYRVRSDKVLDSRRRQISLAGDSGRDRVILITCFPFGDGFAGAGSPFRLEVEAVRI